MADTADKVVAIFCACCDDAPHTCVQQVDIIPVSDLVVMICKSSEVTLTLGRVLPFAMVCVCL